MRPLDSWQEWAVIHGGELLPDGRPRFRIILLLVARQNGKTELLVILAGYWMFVDQVPMVLGTSTKLDYARETWDKTRKLIQRAELLADDLDKRWFVRGNNNIEMWTKADSRYKIAAANEEGGRSLTIDRLAMDELRQHHDYTAWNAAEPAASPIDAQVWCTSNAGDERSVVLNDLREQALTYINTGVGDYRLGLFEWSAEPDADPTDLAALAQANPSLGLRKDPEALLLEAQRAVGKGGEALTGFKTEKMCIRVKLLDPAVDPGAWARCADVVTLDDARSRIALCLDVSPDGLHATLVAAAVLDDDRVRVEVVESWDGANAADKARAALPALVMKVKPQVLGWFPTGPAASLAASLADRRKTGRYGWPPPGVKVEEIRGDLTAACMGFAGEVVAGRVAHPDDLLLNDHVGAAERLKRGDAWVFSRKGAGHVDAAYAAAGAAFLARTLPTPVPFRPLTVVSDDD